MKDPQQFYKETIAAAREQTELHVLAKQHITDAPGYPGGEIVQAALALRPADSPTHAGLLIVGDEKREVDVQAIVGRVDLRGATPTRQSVEETARQIIQRLRQA